MRIAISAVALVFACGGKSATPTTTGPVRPPPAIAVAAGTCVDVAALLRGEVEDADAGKAKQNTIKTSCEADGWSADMIKCVTSSPVTDTCLAKLTPPQRKGYDERIAAWSEEFGEGGEGGDDGDDPPPPLDEGEYIACAGLLDARSFPPAIKETGGDGDFVVKVRKLALDAECEDGWEVATRTCFRDTKGPVDGCIATLSAAQKSALTAKLAEVDTLVKKAFDARKKPATIGCKQAVAVHYSDAAWKGKLDRIKPAERKKAIDASRTKMLKMCTDSKWDATLRACIVSSDSPLCFGASITPWRFPAAGVIVPIGIAECDAFLAETAKIQKCTKLPQATRDAYLQAIESMGSVWADVPEDGRTALAAGCKQGMDAVKQTLSSAGC